MKRTIDKNNFNIAWSLLENGLDFLNDSTISLSQLSEVNAQKTSENYKKKILKNSVIPLVSATELILKHVLFCKNKQLIVTRKQTVTEQDFISGNFTSISGDQITKRLSQYCNINLKETELNSIKKLKTYRNKMEHFKINASYIEILLVELEVIEFLIRFINNYILNNTTLDTEEKSFYDSTIEKLQKLNDFIEIREKQIIDENPSGDFLPCPKCGRTYYNLDKRKCLLCYYEADLADTELNDEYIYNVLGLTAYSCVKDGGVYPIYECPECNHESLVYDSEINQLCFCYECGFKDEASNYQFCPSCGTFMESKKNSTVCDACYEYAWNRN